MNKNRAFLSLFIVVLIVFIVLLFSPTSSLVKINGLE
jgi:hypothetical protein